MMSTGQRFFLALCLLSCIVGTSAAEPRKVYDIDLRVQSVADALNGLSEQTGVPVVFPYDLVKDRKATPVVGRYTLLEALDALLKDTGLSGGLSDKGVLTISLAKSGAPPPGETLVNRENQQNTNDRKAGRHAGIAAFFASIAAAFSASAQDAANGTANSDETKMENVVVTAQKREQRQEDVPVPVSVISAQILTDNGQLLLRDYYTSVPGFTLQADILSGQDLYIRGIATGGNPTVGVTVDDVPFLPATEATAGAFVPDIDPGDLERIEVLRGPQGTLYGSNSMGGLVKYVTKDPSTDGLTGRIEAGTSSVYNGAEPGFNVRGSANIPLTDTLAVRVSGYRRQDPGYIDNPGNCDGIPCAAIAGINETEAYGGRLSALWRPAADFSLKLGAIYQSIRANGTNDVDVAAGLGPWQQNYIPNSSGYSRSIALYSADLKAKLGGVDLVSLTGYSRTSTDCSLDFGFAFGATVQKDYGVSGAVYHCFDTAPKYTQELRLSSSIGDKFDWLVGGFYSYEHLGPNGLQTVEAENPTTGEILSNGFYRFLTFAAYRESAGFADFTYHFTNQFDVQIGARETHSELVGNPSLGYGPGFGPPPYPNVGSAEGGTNNIFTYLFTPEYKISPNLLVYARLASGFRPGQANQLVPNAPPTSSPDKTQNYELGLKGDFLDSKLSLDSSLYYIDWKNIQLSLSNGTYNYNANGSAAKSEGVEESVTARPIAGLTIQGWIAYDNAVLTEAFPVTSTVPGAPGDRLPFAPRFSGHFAFNDDFPLWNQTKGYVGGEVSYVGYREGAFTVGQRTQFPEYTRTDLRAGLKDNSWTFNLYADNVANVRGLVGGGATYLPTNAFIYITPRTIGVNATKSF